MLDPPLRLVELIKFVSPGKHKAVRGLVVIVVLDIINFDVPRKGRLVEAFAPVLVMGIVPWSPQVQHDVLWLSLVGDKGVLAQVRLENLAIHAESDTIWCPCELLDLPSAS